jgi:hypothetical protein
MSDDAEYLKAAIEGAVSGAVAPVKNIVEAIFLPAAKTLGSRLNEMVKPRTHRLTSRTKEFTESLRIEIHTVPMNILVPALQAGSLEENDSLQDRWAALLARAIGGDSFPAAIEILKQLTSDDVELLQVCYDRVHNIEVNVWEPEDQRIRAGAPMPPPPPFEPTGYDLKPALAKRKTQIAERTNHHWMHTGKYGQPMEFYDYLDNVMRLGLITGDGFLTRIGYRFIAACQIPNAKSD